MSIPIRTLPLVERWDCHSCGMCCQGTTFVLSDDEVQRIRRQGWENRPEMQGRPILVRFGWFGNRYRLAKQPDGRCVFLTSENLCRIHAEFGETEKPLVCRLFPLQAVPLGDFAHLTLRRFCPSAAKDEGRPLEDLLRSAKHLLHQQLQRVGSGPPPTVTPRRRLTWDATRAAAAALGRLMLDARFPLVRRLVHGLELCTQLDRCRLHRVEGARLTELLELLPELAVRESGVWFANRQPPRKRTTMLLRQTVLECLRLHPLLAPVATLRERLAMIRAALAWAFGKGLVPCFSLPFPPTTFDGLDRPLGPLDEAAQKPLLAFFETAAASYRYALPGRPGWSLTESFRAMALAYAAGMCLLRLECGEAAPGLEQAVHMVMTLDRGLSYNVLSGTRHRYRVAALASGGELQRLVAWYAR
jgi:lysine-N-methylase